MVKLTAAFAALVALVPLVSAQSPVWGQCGGTGWTGATTCASGSVCTYSNAWYSQCIPGTTTATTTTSKTTATSTTTTTTGSGSSSTGYVKTSGTKFTLNGSRYTVVGGNAYWLALTGLSTANMNTAFADIAAAGGTTVRTWGFNDVTSASGNYFQLWSGSTGTVNTGSTGLGAFDNVVAAAKANGIRLIVVLTNNWSDYGGMDVYVKQIIGSSGYHDQFYTNSAVITAYKKYVNTFVSRYVNEPTILAWELANEPRCKGSAGTTSGSCTTTTITTWIQTMSAYIKSIDSNHLVAVGDEGFFNTPSASTYPYQGGEGIDFTKNLAVSSIDFGTFHSYPVGWGQTSDPTGWGSQWITDHANAAISAGKPAILEEFGVTSSQSTTYTQWYSTIISSGLAGDLIWQAGSHLSSGDTPNDGYTIYPDNAVYALEKSHAAALKARG